MALCPDAVHFGIKYLGLQHIIACNVAMQEKFGTWSELWAGDTIPGLYQHFFYCETNQAEEPPIILKRRNNVQTGHNNNDNTGWLYWEINTAT
jgi:hypothetical protein